MPGWRPAPPGALADFTAGAERHDPRRQPPRYPNRLGTSAEVRAILQAFCADPRHEFCPDDISLLDGAHLARPVFLTPDRTTDLYLLALARQHNARLATFDRHIPTAAVQDGAASLMLLEA